MGFKDGVKGFIAKLKSDGHIPVALFVFVVTTIIHVITKRDLGPQYVNSLYAMYGFLAGDKYFQNKYGPDATDATTTTTTTTTT